MGDEIPRKFDGEIISHRTEFEVWFNGREIVEQGIVGTAEDVYLADSDPGADTAHEATPPGPPMPGLLLLYERHWQTGERLLKKGQVARSTDLLTMRGQVEIRRKNVRHPRERLEGGSDQV